MLIARRSVELLLGGLFRPYLVLYGVHQTMTRAALPNQMCLRHPDHPVWKSKTIQVQWRPAHLARVNLTGTLVSDFPHA